MPDTISELAWQLKLSNNTVCKMKKGHAIIVSYIGIFILNASASFVGFYYREQISFANIAMAYFNGFVAVWLIGWAFVIKWKNLLNAIEK